MKSFNLFSIFGNLDLPNYKKMRKRSLIIFITLLLGINASSQQLHVDTNRLKANLKYLASDELAGRDAGTISELIAAKFIVSEFEKYGIKPFFDTTYLQEFKMVSNATYDSSKLTIYNDTDEKTYYHKKDFFVPRKNFVPSGLNSEIVFAGYGIIAPEYNHDDYKDIDAKGKIVVILDGEPKSNDAAFFDGSRITKYSQNFNYKRKEAKNQGAIAVLIVAGNDLINHWSDKGSGWKREYKGKEKEKEYTELPTYYISEKLFSGLLKTYFGYAELNKGLAYDQLKSKNIDYRVKLNINATPQVYKSYNVIGIIPGNGPQLKNEYIAVGAHYDHVGINDGEVYNGADDNASGTVAVLEIARNHLKTKSNKRSIIYCLWGAEEQGLLGSKYFVDNHPDINNVKAYINLDMIGRGEADTIKCIYKFSESYKDSILKFTNSGQNFNVEFQEDYAFGASDDMYFDNNNVQTITFHDEDFTDYHKPSDDYEKIDYEKIGKTASLVYNIINDLSSNEFNFIDNEPVDKEEESARSFSFGNVFVGIDGTMLKGKKIRFSASAKVADNQGQLWVREDRLDGEMGFFYNMYDNPITAEQWGDYEITGQLSDAVEEVYFGAFLVGKGELWVDNYELFYLDDNLNWQKVELKYSGFEVKDIKELDDIWIIRPDANGEIQITKKEKKEGAKSIRISNF